MAIGAKTMQPYHAIPNIGCGIDNNGFQHIELDSGLRVELLKYQILLMT
jgi:hypothetical protein